MEGQTERENRVTLKEARYILSSRTKDADSFRQIVHSLYLDFIKRHVGTVPKKGDAEEKPKDSVLLAMKETNKKLDKMIRNLYEERTGQKWRSPLRVIQGGGNTSPITRKVTRHKKPDHL